MDTSSASEMCDDELYPVFQNNRDQNDVSTNETELNNEHLENVNAKDSFEIFGQHVACKLRDMHHFQKIICEKVINDTLFLAQLGMLTVDATIVPGETADF